MSEHELYAWTLSIGWTLIHFLWQGGLISLALAAFLALTRERSSSERYLVRCAALVMMAVAPVVTFLAVRGSVPAATSLPAAMFGSDSAQGVQEELVGSPWFSWLASGDLFSWIVFLWTLGAAVCSLRLVGGLLQVLRLRRRAVGIALAPRWQQRFDSLAREFGVRARARVVECVSVAVPTVIGWVKPVVLLPARIFTGLSDEQIEALIAHELAHVSRHDYLVNFLQSILEALLFYHPAVWWVSRGIRVEREYCCDDRAVAATHDGLSYARALTALETWRGGEPQLGVSTLGGSLMQRIQRLVGGRPVAKPGPVRPFHALAALALVGSMGASAFGLTAFPDPSPDGDCPCPCHKKQAKAPPPKLDRLLLRTDVDDRWVVPGDTDEIRKAWIRFGDEEEVLLDFTRGKADADHLLRSVSDLRAQIAALEKQLAELTAIREHVDPRELLDRDLWEVEEAEPRGFWSTRRPSAKQDEERDPKVERYWRVGGERRAQERRPARRRVEGRRLPERVREFQFKEQDELLKQAKKVREEALKQGETKRRYLELKVQYDAESGILEVKPHLEALDFYRQKAPGGEGEARPPRTKRYHRRFFQRDEPEGESPFVYFGDEGERPGWYRYEGTADGDTILDLTNEIQVDGDHVLHPEQLESIRVQVLDLLKPLQNIEFDFDEDFEGFELDENVIRVLLEDANEHVIKALKAKDGNLILEIKRDQKPR